MQRRFMTRRVAKWLLLYAIAVGVTAVVAMARPGTAGAHFSLGSQYSHKQCPVSEETRKDPITVIFWANGTTSASVNHLVYHTGWGTTSSSTQYFVDHGDCGAQHAQRASADCGDCNRFHIRQHRLADQDGYRDWSSVATPHWEERCPSGGHGIPWLASNWSGFDEGRLQVANAMNVAHHPQEVAYWGNNGRMIQCGGAWPSAGSNGYVRWIQIPYWTH